MPKSHKLNNLVIIGIKCKPFQPGQKILYPGLSLRALCGSSTCKPLAQHGEHTLASGTPLLKGNWTSDPPNFNVVLINSLSDPNQMKIIFDCWKCQSCIHKWCARGRRYFYYRNPPPTPLISSTQMYTRTGDLGQILSRPSPRNAPIMFLIDLREPSRLTHEFFSPLSS